MRERKDRKIRGNIIAVNFKHYYNKSTFNFFIFVSMPAICDLFDWFCVIASPEIGNNNKNLELC